MLKLKLQYFGHLMQRTDSLEKTWCWERLKAGGEGDNWGWDGWMASLTRWTWLSASFRSWWWTGKPGVLQSMGLQRVRHDWMSELNWKTRDHCHMPGSRRSPGEGHGNPLQYCCLENLMDKGVWQATVHSITQSWIWLKRVSVHSPSKDKRSLSLQPPLQRRPLEFCLPPAPWNLGQKSHSIGNANAGSTFKSLFLHPNFCLLAWHGADAFTGS